MQAKWEEHERLKTEIIDLQKQIAKIEDDERTLNATKAEEYLPEDITTGLENYRKIL